MNEADILAKAPWPSEQALIALERIRSRIAAKGYCAFHELSHENTDLGEQGIELGLALRELYLRGLVVSGLDPSGLVSCEEIADKREVARLVDGLVEIRPPLRSRPSGLAERLAA